MLHVLFGLSWIYILFLGIWIVVRLIFKDRWWWLEFLNSLTLYWFIPLLFITILAVISLNINLLILSLILILMPIRIIVGYYYPHRSSQNPSQNTLTVMTHNLLKDNHQTSEVIDTIFHSDAEIIAFQELTTPSSQAISTHFREVYPYQAIEPPQKTETNSWNGFISKFPISSISTLPGIWMSPPIVCRVNYRGIPITLVNIHTHPTKIGAKKTSEISKASRIRRDQILRLTDFLSHLDTPYIVMGDFNTTDQNLIYHQLTKQMNDTWLMAGKGPGFTFGLRPHTFGNQLSLPALPIPKWILRIDYIFCSKDIHTIHAYTGILDGKSDHRPIIATLYL